MSLSPGLVSAKPTSKLSPSMSSQNLKHNPAKKPQIKNISTSKKLTASGNTKMQVDPSTVPAMGSYTEAGVTAPGIVSGPAPAVPHRNYSASNYEPPLNTGMATMGGILNLFSMAAQVGQRVNPRAGDGPMFINECKDCIGRANTAGTPQVITSAGSPNIAPATNLNSAPATNPNSVSIVRSNRGEGEEGGGGDGEVAHGEVVMNGSSDKVVEMEPIDQDYVFNHKPHLKIIGQETFKPFVGVNSEEFIAAFGASAAHHELMVTMSGSEMSSLCSNYSNLSVTQRETLMIYMYSEILKQTSDYESYRVSITPAKEGRKSIESYGMCQLSLVQAKALKEAYPRTSLARLPVNDEESLQAYIMETRPSVEPDICTLKILRENFKNSTHGSTPLKSAFPKVDFDAVKAKIDTLKMCAQPVNS